MQSLQFINLSRVIIEELNVKYINSIFDKIIEDTLSFLSETSRANFEF